LEGETKEKIYFCGIIYKRSVAVKLAGLEWPDFPEQWATVMN
jgi:hypothetical protein